MPEEPDYEALSVAVDKLLGEHITGMTTAWSMVVEHLSTDAVHGVTFVSAPDQHLTSGMAHARMLTLCTDEQFAYWHDVDDDDE